MEVREANVTRRRINGVLSEEDGELSVCGKTTSFSLWIIKCQSSQQEEERTEEEEEEEKKRRTLANTSNCLAEAHTGQCFAYTKSISPTRVLILISFATNIPSPSFLATQVAGKTFSANSKLCNVCK